MSTEKPANHRTATWLMRSGAAILFGGGAVFGLHAAEAYNEKYAPTIDVAAEAQSRQAEDVAADIALLGLVPLAAGSGLRLVGRQQVHPAGALDTPDESLII